MGVAGITVPAFVERARRWSSRARRAAVSPGLRSRPSLSAPQRRQPDVVLTVSPGLRSRPSLSGLAADGTGRGRTVSPGLRSRPSLSGARRGHRRRSMPASVAGITVPAFVERRTRTATARGRPPGVAGITVPAFVERPASAGTATSVPVPVSPGLRSRPSLSDRESRSGSPLGRTVSPGLRSWPSLSGGPDEQPCHGGQPCRRDYGPGLR